jgi:hypothetical protein
MNVTHKEVVAILKYFGLVAPPTMVNSNGDTVPNPLHEQADPPRVATGEI